MPPRTVRLRKPRTLAQLNTDFGTAAGQISVAGFAAGAPISPPGVGTWSEVALGPGNTTNQRRVITPAVGMYPNGTGVTFYLNNVLNRTDPTGANDGSVFHTWPVVTLASGDVLRATWTDVGGAFRESTYMVPVPAPTATGTISISGTAWDGTVSQWPTEATTGLSNPGAVVAVGGTVTSSFAGQVIENIECTRIKVIHDNVIVRNCRVLGGPGTWVAPVDLAGSFYNPYNLIEVWNAADQPTNVVVEDCEVNGNGNHGCVGIYGINSTIRRNHVFHCRSSSQITSNCTVENNLFHLEIWGVTNTGAGTHGTAMSCHGGTNNVIRGNYLWIGKRGASAALSLYGDFAVINNVLVENNLFNGGSYGTNCGSVNGKPYPLATNTTYRNNAFGRDVWAEGADNEVGGTTVGCGRYGPFAAWNGSGTGNIWTGNYWEDTLLPVGTEDTTV